SPGVGLFHFWRSPAFGRYQRSAQGSLQRELLAGTLGGVRQRLEQLEPFRESADRLDMRRALNGALAGPLPIRDSLRVQAGLGVVMGQQLRLCRADRGKTRLQHLGNTLLLLLARAPQQ